MDMVKWANFIYYLWAFYVGFFYLAPQEDAY